ncbi:MAG: rod shape-determining protein MreC [Bacteriovoracaceae bacterium]|nr:rod shape-determining protein MreC [Bacteriovoracaceae bacterium]
MKVLSEDRQRPKIIVNVIVLCVALFGVSKTDVKLSKSSAFERLMVDSVAPLQKSIMQSKQWVSLLFEDYFNNVAASKNNRSFKKEISNLKNKIFKYEELAKENKRLKDLLKFGEEIKAQQVLAQIVAWDASSDYKVIRINKGARDGIKLQSTAVTAEGIVGYVYRLTDHFADILTILDTKNRVDAIVERTRSHGIIEGLSNDKCLMKYVTRIEPVIINDVVITSGLGNIYPKGIKIGTISRIDRESYGITQHIEITPSVNFNRLEEVIILFFKRNELHKVEWDVLDNPK